jgi:hypothetical protein
VHTKEFKLSGPKEMLTQIYNEMKTKEQEFALEVQSPKPKPTPTRGPLTTAAAVFMITVLVDVSKQAAYQIWLEDYIEKKVKPMFGGETPNVAEKK